MDRFSVWWISGPWLVLLLYWGMAALRVQPARRREAPLSRLRHSVLIVLAAFLLFSNQLQWGPLSRRFLPDHPAVFFAGVALTMIGVCFAIWARYHLGAYWSGTVTIKQDHRLIRTGPYAVVRHPIYAGILFGMLGTAVAVGELRGVLAVLLFFAAFSIKIRLEECWLLQEIGPEYEQYRHEVRGLIPFLY
jgi:protein-S-isoprenylcysteine O-methyltransferase Ste14